MGQTVLEWYALSLFFSLQDCRKKLCSLYMLYFLSKGFTLEVSIVNVRNRIWRWGIRSWGLDQMLEFH